MICVKPSWSVNYRNLTKFYIKDLGGATHVLRQTVLAGKLETETKQNSKFRI